MFVFLENTIDSYRPVLPLLLRELRVNFNGICGNLGVLELKTGKRLGDPPQGVIKSLFAVNDKDGRPQGTVEGLLWVSISVE